MKTYNRVTGEKSERWTGGRSTGPKRALWLFALLLLAGGGLARAEGPDKLVCPQPRDVSQCTPAQGLTPGVDCNVYEENKDWLPPAYVINAACVCNAPNDALTSDCAHAKIRAQTLAAPEALREEGRRCNSKHGLERDACFEKHLTPFLHQIHVNAYTECCCPCGPSSYATWKAITVVPIKNCKETVKLFDLFGSCQGTPGKW
jgi:hypothetical protein